MKKKFGKWLLLLLPLFWIGGSAYKTREAAHPFYISVTEINHNAAEKTLEISCKLFADDMEDALKQNFRTVVDISNAAQQDRSGDFINQYVQKNLHVVANGRQVPLQFVGFEKESESVYCYLEAANLPSVKKLEVANSLLHDFTKDQINILHVTVGGKRQSTKLNFPFRNASFEF